MVKRAMNRFAKRLRDEGGQALVMVLALLMIGGLVLPPVLSHIGTALKTGVGYQDKTDELYAADSGVEDAIWQIKFDRLEVLFTDPEYDIYDYDNVWSYDLDDPVNGLTPEVTIQNIWVPMGVSHLDPAEARDIIESNKLMVAGTTSGETGYKIKLNFTPGEGEEDSLTVASLGIWLPLGFSYVDGSSNLEGIPSSENLSIEVTPYFGGEAVVWEYDPPLPFTSLPGVDLEAVPMTTDITFDHEPSTPGTTPVAIAWIVTGGELTDVPISWDIDTRIFKITSVVGDTEIEAYSAKCELRKMGAAIAGDYRAVGNSLMIDSNHDYYNIRDTVLGESDAEIDDIPESADVVAAYLYWSGWFEQGQPTTPLWEDDCADFSEWTNESSWSLVGGYFKGHDETGRYLTMTDSIDLSAYTEGGVAITWEQWEGTGSLDSNDRLDYQYSSNGVDWSGSYVAFSNDIGATRVSFITDPIPEEYLTSGTFKFRFRINDFNAADQNCYVDNIAIYELEYVADTDCFFKINGQQVYLDAQGDPQIGSENITAGEAQVLENQPGQYSYACHRDVTRLVKAYSDLGDGENHTGNGTYTAGGVSGDTGEHWSYAGWSLLIIYSSPETAGHQLYLYDTFAWAHQDQNLDFDDDGEPGGSITNFYVPDPSEDLVQYPNAATLTCFVAEGDNWISGDQLIFNDTALSDGYSTSNVWNSRSVGMSEDGVDIDTFVVTWASGLLDPGDTTAQLDLPTGTDNWNLIYIILSLRSETVTGGTTHYVIRSG